METAKSLSITPIVTLSYSTPKHQMPMNQNPESVTEMVMVASTSTNDSVTVSVAEGFSLDWWQQVIGGLFMFIIIAGTVGGNILVFLSLLLVKKLRQPSNLLLLSLSISDQLIAITVEPFAMYKTVMGNQWKAPWAFCQAYLFLDVMMCTASILNLNMITIDKFLVITWPFQYQKYRNKKLMGVMIIIVWIVSAVVSATAFFWSPPNFSKYWDPPDNYSCNYPADAGYQIYATVTAFFAPEIIMLVLWGRIFLVAKKMAEVDQAQQGAVNRGADRSVNPQHSGGKLPSPEQVAELKRLSESSKSRKSGDDDLLVVEHPNGSAKKYSDQSDLHPLQKENRGASVASSGQGGKKGRPTKENKALRTVAIIMG